MAPQPKPPGTRVRRNKDQPQWKTLPAAAAASTPAAPDYWSEGTKDWWRRIWASPMASLWIDADIPNLFELGDLIEHPRKSAMHYQEIRQMKACYGLTPASRRALMWNVPAADEEGAEDEVPAAASNVRKLRAV